ncbi:MAG: ROK family protein [Propioniciclava sp.]
MSPDSPRHWSGVDAASRLRSTAKTLPAGARARNRQLVLRTLFHRREASRAQLARATGLTAGTTSTLVRDLAEEGLIEESAPQRRHAVGKPSTPLRINPDAFHIVALDLGDPDDVVGAVVNLHGEVLARGTAAIGVAGDLGALSQAIGNLVAATDRPVLGVGLTTPGIIDVDGVALKSTTYTSWRNLPLQKRLSSSLGLPVSVANDANSATLAEFTFGGAPADGLMVITLAKGIGAGFMLGGTLVQGDGSAVGEIGHITTVEDGLACECGRRGCLQTVISGPVLRQLQHELHGSALDSAVAAIGRQTGVVLAPLVGSLALREIRISGRPELLKSPLLAAIEETARARVLPITTPPVVVRPATLGGDTQVLGGAALVLSSQLGIA